MGFIWIYTKMMAGRRTTTNDGYKRKAALEIGKEKREEKINQPNEKHIETASGNNNIIL